MVEPVAVIIPCYNHGQYVGRAIDSVLRQTIRASEIIVVDDGSTDETQRVVSHYRGAIRSIYQENRGLPAARNRGVAESAAEWIAFLDADDEWLEDKLATQLEVVRAHPEIHAVFSDVMHVTPDGVGVVTGLERHRQGTAMVRWKHCEAPLVWVSTSRLITPLLYGLDACVCTLLMRRCHFDDVGGFNENCCFAEDLELWLRMALNDCIFGLVPTVHARIWQYTDSMCRGNRCRLAEYQSQILTWLLTEAGLESDERTHVRARLAETELVCAWACRHAGEFREAIAHAYRAFCPKLSFRASREMLLAMMHVRSQ